jgi:hypothetical protein
MINAINGEVIITNIMTNLSKSFIKTIYDNGYHKSLCSQSPRGVPIYYARASPVFL